MNNQGLLSMESIDFQYPLVYKQLIEVFTKLGKSSSTNDYIDSAIEIAELVKHGTGMSIRLTFDETGGGAYVMIPQLSAQHPLFTGGIFALSNVDGLTMIRKAKRAVSGSVDTKRCRVDGVFKEVTLQIHLPQKRIKDDSMTAEETAAVFLHELGHGFVYFEYLTRTCTTNQVLAGISKGLDESDTYENKHILLTETAKTVGLSSVDISTLAATTDRRTLHTVVIAALNKEYAKETGYDIYDHTANEALADQYATRMGAGRALVTGLDKIYRRSGDMSYRTTPTYLMIEAAKISLLMLTPYFIVAGAPGFGTLNGYLALVAFSMILNDATEFGMAGHYDMPGDRFKRIRSQLVEQLKNRDLDKNEISALTDDIAAIDNLTVAINDRRQFFGVLQDLLTSNRRFNRDMKLLQQSLEKLAANDLFVSAARLTVAAKA